MKDKIRVESDSLGKIELPEDVYYGAQTMRAVLNFPISSVRLDITMVDAVAHIKRAAAAVHLKQGRLSHRQAGAIIQACDEILFGGYHREFVVDVFQMGAGTSFHMNCNEVIANRAEEILAGRKGEYKLIHPNDHVNMGQSTNDVIPTALRLSVLFLLHRGLYEELDEFAAALIKKGKEFDKIVKSGRTHMQDAAPVRLGQEFTAYGVAVRKSKATLEAAASELRELGIGGSAVGTGLNTRPDYANLMIEELAESTSLPLRAAENRFEAMQSRRAAAGVSAALRNLSVELCRIANDLRLLASGPRTGFGEIRLPAVAPGSSIMPGKINPSMLEMLNMVCFHVIGCDVTVAAAVQAGQLELNVMIPVIAHNLHFPIRILARSLHQVRTKCIDGITADEDRCREYAENSLGLATALGPVLGFRKAAEVAERAGEEGRSLLEIIREEELIPEDDLAAIFDLDGLTEPCVPGEKK